MIRVVNQTNQQLTDVSVFSFKSDGADVERKYGSIAPGALSGYISHQQAFNEPLFKFTIAGYGVTEVRELRCGNGLMSLSDGKYALIIVGDESDPHVYLEAD